jgi:hypothetical protein
MKICDSPLEKRERERERERDGITESRSRRVK